MDSLRRYKKGTFFDKMKKWSLSGKVNIKEEKPKKGKYTSLQATYEMA